MGSTLIAICARDRLDLVRDSLASIRREFPDRPILFRLDPESEQLQDLFSIARDFKCELIDSSGAPRELKPHERATHFRKEAVRDALAEGFEFIHFLDSDALLGQGYAARQAELMAVPGWRSVSLFSWRDYARRYRLGDVPEAGAYWCKYGLGIDQLFPVETFRGVNWHQPRLCEYFDTWTSEHLGEGRNLVSNRSWVLHLGCKEGISAEKWGTRLQGDQLMADLEVERLRRRC